MPRGKSRSWFIALHIAARGEAERRQITLEWNRKTLEQREEWRKRYEPIHNNVGTLQRSRGRLPEALDEINTAVADASDQERPRLWREALVKINSYTKQCKDLQEGYKEQARSWASLQNLEDAQERVTARAEIVAAARDDAGGNGEGNNDDNEGNDEDQGGNDDGNLLYINEDTDDYIDNAVQEALRNANRVKQMIAAAERQKDNLIFPMDEHHQRPMPAGWVDDDMKIRKRRRDLHIASQTAQIGLRQPGGPGTWEAWKDHSGGLSMGWLWIKFSPAGNVIDRVFRKDTFMEQWDWRDPARWEGNIADPDVKIPWELACHDALDAVPGLRSVVRLRERLNKGLIDDDNRSYRMYMEWCQYRDLNDLIVRHKGNNAGDSAAIPESMVWYVAECLIESGLAMESGGLNTVASDWPEIVHRDLKPGNVFLGAPNPNRYPRFPTPLLGDFGLAFRTPIGDPNNPFWYNSGSGTPGFMAPEQRPYVDSQDLSRISEWELNAQTNVYGVGMILWCLVNLGYGPAEQPEWLGCRISYHPLRINRGGLPMRNYSSELLDMIESCIEYNPDDRPSFAQLGYTIFRETSEAPGMPNRSERMRSGAAIPAVADLQRVLKGDDLYQLNVARAQLPV